MASMFTFYIYWRIEKILWLLCLLASWSCNFIIVYLGNSPSFIQVALNTTETMLRFFPLYIWDGAVKLKNHRNEIHKSSRITWLFLMIVRPKTLRRDFSACNLVCMGLDYIHNIEQRSLKIKSEWTNAQMSSIFNQKQIYIKFDRMAALMLN